MPAMVISFRVLLSRAKVPPGPLAVRRLRQGTLENTINSGGAAPSAIVIVIPYPLGEGGRRMGAALEALNL